MRLALFDLDGTLLDGDHDLEWALHLSAKGLVAEAPIRRFMVDYERGELDIEAFCDWQLAPLGVHPGERLEAWRAEYFTLRIRPRLRAWVRALLERHIALGHTVALITAANRFLTEPTAAHLGGVPLIATEPERVGGRFTGRWEPPPCFRQGKLAHLERWLAGRGARWSDVEESWAYSDSINDLPLLSRADHPVVVAGDARLSVEACRRGWIQLDAHGRSLPRPGQARDRAWPPTPPGRGPARPR